VNPIKTHTREYLERLIATLEAMPVDAIERLSEVLYRAYTDGKQVFILGNGGSASTASHMAADLGKNTIGPNMRRFRIMSLNDNIPLLTALSNDVGYDNVFAEQLQNLIQPGDVLIAISGSGNSPNVLRAMEYAHSRSAETVAMLGFGGGKAAELADLVLLVEADDYGVVEDAHLIVNHILVEHFRQRLAEEQPWST
jgi:D-sedoheptulose 7-phosphate isomerase